MFVRPVKINQPIDDFARQHFGWLKISQFDRNVCAGKDQWDEFYFTGSAVGIEVQVYQNNRKGLEKYPFVVSFLPEGTRQAADYLEQHAELLAWRLSRDGFRCFIAKDPITASSEQEGMVYDA